MPNNLRSITHCLRYTPLHPQWFAYRCEKKRHKIIGRLARGRILDIGCGRQTIRKFFKATHTYFGLDSLETGLNLYNSIPNVFADAANLPFHDETFDTVILLEVLEHLADPTLAMREAQRVLKLDGILIVSTPFLYPIHDAPKDFQRWTQFGLQHLLQISGSATLDFHVMGSPVEAGTLLLNLSLAWTTLQTPLIFKLPLLIVSVVLIPLLNIMAFFLSPTCTVFPKHPFAIGYLVAAKRA